ncbi:MAG: hypothetical protein EXR72_09810 [Myxococcales bacterium]|nr:hypothetical protein [Myxococcales bacterium]
MLIPDRSASHVALAALLAIASGCKRGAPAVDAAPSSTCSLEKAELLRAGDPRIDALRGGFFFVARSREASVRWDEHDEGAEDLAQEAYHADFRGGACTRLTDTGGRVQAIGADPSHRFLSFVLAARITRGGERSHFIEPRIGWIDLRTLVTAGPFPVPGRRSIVDLVFSYAGDPILVTDGDQWTWDGTKRVFVAGRLEPTQIDPARGRTLALPERVHHYGAPTVATRIGADGRSIAIDGQGAVARVEREIETTTVEWSPGRKRLAFAGVFATCPKKRDSAPEDNQLFLYDAATRAAAPIARARSAFDSLWLDDDRLVYEAGTGAAGRLHLLHVPTGADRILDTPFGAGLFGLAAPCD